MAPALEALGAGVYGGIRGRTSDWAVLPIPVSVARYGPAMAVKSAVVVDTGRVVSVTRCWRGLGCLGGPISVTVWGFGTGNTSGTVVLTTGGARGVGEYVECSSSEPGTLSRKKQESQVRWELQTYGL